MKNLVKIIGICTGSVMILSNCSIEANTAGEKKKNKSKEALNLSAPMNNATLIVNNDQAFAMKGCKYRW